MDEFVITNLLRSCDRYVGGVISNFAVVRKAINLMLSLRAPGLKPGERGPQPRPEALRISLDELKQMALKTRILYSQCSNIERSVGHVTLRMKLCLFSFFVLWSDLVVYPK